MKNPNQAKGSLQPEYDLRSLKGGVRGKYHARATANSTVALIDPDLAGIFPDSESVNRALRLLAETAAAAGTRGRGAAREKRPKARAR